MAEILKQKDKAFVLDRDKASEFLQRKWIRVQMLFVDLQEETIIKKTLKNKRYKMLYERSELEFTQRIACIQGI